MNTSEKGHPDQKNAGTKKSPEEEAKKYLSVPAKKTRKKHVSESNCSSENGEDSKRNRPRSSRKKRKLRDDSSYSSGYDSRSSQSSYSRRDRNKKYTETSWSGTSRGRSSRYNEESKRHSKRTPGGKGKKARSRSLSSRTSSYSRTSRSYDSRSQSASNLSRTRKRRTDRRRSYSDSQSGSYSDSRSRSYSRSRRRSSSGSYSRSAKSGKTPGMNQEKVPKDGPKIKLDAPKVESKQASPKKQAPPQASVPEQQSQKIIAPTQELKETPQPIKQNKLKSDNSSQSIPSEITEDVTKNIPDPEDNTQNASLGQRQSKVSQQQQLPNNIDAPFTPLRQRKHQQSETTPNISYDPSRHSRYNAPNIVEKTPTVRSKFLAGSLQRSVRSTSKISNLSGSYRGVNINDHLDRGNTRLGEGAKQQANLPGYRQRNYTTASNRTTEEVKKGLLSKKQLSKSTAHPLGSGHQAALPEFKSQFSRMQPTQQKLVQKQPPKVQDAAAYNPLVTSQEYSSLTNQVNGRGQKHSSGATFMPNRGRQALTSNAAPQPDHDQAQKDQTERKVSNLRALLSDSSRTLDRSKNTQINPFEPDSAKEDNQQVHSQLDGDSVTKAGISSAFPLIQNLFSNLQNVGFTSNQKSTDQVVTPTKDNNEVVKVMKQQTQTPTSKQKVRSNDEVIEEMSLKSFEVGASLGLAQQATDNKQYSTNNDKKNVFNTRSPNKNSSSKNNRRNSIWSRKRSSLSKTAAATELHYEKNEGKPQDKTMLDKLSDYIPANIFGANLKESRAAKVNSAQKRDSFSGQLNFSNLARETDKQLNQSLNKSRSSKPKRRSVKKSLASRKEKISEEHSETFKSPKELPASQVKKEKQHRRKSSNQKQLIRNSHQREGKESERVEFCPSGAGFSGSERMQSPNQRQFMQIDGQINHQHAQAHSKIKRELNNLITKAVEIEKVTPLIFEEEQVVEHLQRIEEFFDTLNDDLSEVRDYMIALLEQVEESQNKTVKLLIPTLNIIIELLQIVCSEQQNLEMSEGQTPGFHTLKNFDGSQETFNSNGRFGGMMVKNNLILTDPDLLISPIPQNNSNNDMKPIQAETPSEGMSPNFSSKAPGNQKIDLNPAGELKNSEQRAQELQRQCTQKKAELEALRRKNLKKQFEICFAEVREKYAEVEDKIKVLEQKATGSVQQKFNINIISLFEKFLYEKHEESQMFNFIRDEWLSLILARKQYVKEQKEKQKAEKKEKKKGPDQSSELSQRVNLRPVNRQSQKLEEKKFVGQKGMQPSASEKVIQKRTGSQNIDLSKSLRTDEFSKNTQVLRSVRDQQQLEKSPPVQRVYPYIFNLKRNDKKNMSAMNQTPRDRRESSIFKQKRQQSVISANSNSERGTTGAGFIIESIRNQQAKQ